MTATDRPQVLPYVFARRHGLAVSAVEDDVLTLISRGTPSIEAVSEAQRVLRCPMRLQKLDDEAFASRLGELYGSDSEVASRLSEDLHDEMGLEDAAAQLPAEDLLESADDAPMIRFINALLSEAVNRGASDVHIEPFEQQLLVRFRVDGHLTERLRTDRRLAVQIASRIKVMAKLDIAEKRLPHDGRISLRIAGRAVDVRVSTLPSNHGERLVLRLLDKQAGRLDLPQLGLQPDALQRLLSLIQQPHGIILVTGPTGSGKTTSLYAALSEINDGQRNIMTVEDPIEYDLAGIGQTQVNGKVGMTFAKGLRAILRQDPDVVMVGEIRDRETAEIAVQASLTGHLVLSTLHTNTAVGAITRLRDMGVEAFLIGSSLTGVIAQRLVRRLCPHCRAAKPATAAERQLFAIEAEDAILYHPVGCGHCNQQGYRGRFGLYEILVVDEAMRNAIALLAGEAELLASQSHPGQSLKAKAVAAIMNGDTSPEEAMRIMRGSGG